MRYNNEGLTLWYGSEDTPAPEGVVESGDNLSVIAAVSPANPSNTVSLLYRVEGGFERTVRATLLRIENGAGQQYFKAVFPRLSPGSKVEYTIIGENSGRRVPNPCAMTVLTRQFEVQSAFA